MAESAVKRKHVPEDMTVGFIGSGRMAQAMARGFISTGEWHFTPFTHPGSVLRGITLVKNQLNPADADDAMF